MTNAEKARVVVVLAGARNPLNIGAAARAMSNFGFTDLRIVTEFPLPVGEAKSAVDAAEVMRRAVVFSDFREAIQDCAMVFGTTAVGDRRLEQEILELPAAVEGLHIAAARGEKVAIVFGSEKTGMSNEQISYCTSLLTIPMEVHGTSMNLGQSVAVVLWEMVRKSADRETASAQKAGEGSEAEAAPSGSMDRFEAVLQEGLRETGYESKFPANCGEEMVRRLVRRMKLSKRDAEIWTGIWRQVLWKVRKLAAE